MSGNEVMIFVLCCCYIIKITYCLLIVVYEEFVHHFRGIKGFIIQRNQDSFSEISTKMASVRVS